MSLAKQQRAIVRLINDVPLMESIDDDYIQKLVKSPDLKLTQEIIQWWKSYRIERFCPLTSQLLKQLNLFDNETEKFEPKGINHHYIENVGMAFLSHLCNSKVPLISSVSQFEYALIKVKMGDDKGYIVYWNQDPIQVINSLVAQTPLAQKKRDRCFKIHLSRDLPETFMVLSQI